MYYLIGFIVSCFIFHFPIQISLPILGLNQEGYFLEKGGVIFRSLGLFSPHLSIHIIGLSQNFYTLGGIDFPVYLR